MATGQQQQQCKRQISQTDGIVPIDVSAYRTYKPEIGRKAAEFTQQQQQQQRDRNSPIKNILYKRAEIAKEIHCPDNIDASDFIRLLDSLSGITRPASIGFVVTKRITNQR